MSVTQKEGFLDNSQNFPTVAIYLENIDKAMDCGLPDSSCMRYLVSRRFFGSLYSIRRSLVPFLLVSNRKTIWIWRLFSLRFFFATRCPQFCLFCLNDAPKLCFRNYVAVSQVFIKSVIYVESYP